MTFPKLPENSRALAHEHRCHGCSWMCESSHVMHVNNSWNLEIVLSLLEASSSQPLALVSREDVPDQ